MNINFKCDMCEPCLSYNYIPCMMSKVTNVNDTHIEQLLSELPQNFSNFDSTNLNPKR